MNFTAGDISLWKPTEDLPDNRNKILETTGSWQLNPDTGKEVDGRAIFLTPSSTVGDEFSSPAPACVHVIVQPPSREDLNIESGSSNEVPDHGMKRRRGEMDDLIMERKRPAKMAKCALSSLSTPSTSQTSAQQVVACNRPFDFDTIPITLLEQREEKKQCEEEQKQREEEQRQREESKRPNGEKQKAVTANKAAEQCQKQGAAGPSNQVKSNVTGNKRSRSVFESGTGDANDIDEVICEPCKADGIKCEWRREGRAKACVQCAERRIGCKVTGQWRMKAQKRIREEEKSTNTTMKEDIRALVRMEMELTKQARELMKQSKEQNQIMNDLIAILAPSKSPAHSPEPVPVELN
ncbi:hypothetical protein AX14_012965 [Amanita brunnescens Koide BX004]|nr:hypothetical protein AX14_012965 [Amanita brunnescens Koide BX004]